MEMQVWKCMHINSYIYIYGFTYVYFLNIHVYTTHTQTHYILFSALSNVACVMLSPGFFSSGFHLRFFRVSPSPKWAPKTSCKNSSERHFVQVGCPTVQQVKLFLWAALSFIYILIFARIDPVCIRPPCFAVDYMYIYTHAVYVYNGIVTWLIYIYVYTVVALH